MFILLNNVRTRLTKPLAAGDVTAYIPVGDAAQFNSLGLVTGTQSVRAALVRVDGFQETQFEIVDITTAGANATDGLLTITRGLEGTTALSFSVGDLVDVRATAGLLRGGELIKSSVASGSAVALTTNVVANVTSIALTAGEWDVSGTLDYSPAATTNVTLLQGAVSLTSATIPPQTGGGGLDEDCSTRFAYGAAGIVPASGIKFPTPIVRVSVAAPTTCYLVGLAAFTVSTLGVFGTLRARRVQQLYGPN